MTKSENAPTTSHSCKNCSNDFRGNFCPQCGQSVFEYQRPFRFLLADFTGNLFAFDTRFWKSLKALTIQPGRLTQDFISGKRARYMPPFRFYIFISFIFFLVFSSFLGNEVAVSAQNKEKVYQALEETEALPPEVIQAIDSINAQENTLNINFNLGASAQESQTSTQEENAQNLADVEKLKGAVVSVMENPKIYLNSFLKFLSWSLFLLMPVYALLLWLFNKSTTPYYFAHLIMAVNQHSFWFLVLTLYFGIRILFLQSSYHPEQLLLWLLPIHTFLGYKQLYKRGWGRTLSKSFGIFICYAIVMAIAIGIIFSFWVKSEFL